MQGPIVVFVVLVDGILEGAGVEHVVDDGLGVVGVALDVQLDHDPGRPLGRMLVEELHRGGDRQLIELESCALVDPLDFAAVLGRFVDGPTGAVLALTVGVARTANVLGDDSLSRPNGSRVRRLAGGQGARVVAPSAAAWSVIAPPVQSTKSRYRRRTSCLPSAAW